MKHLKLIVPALVAATIIAATVPAIEGLDPYTSWVDVDISFQNDSLNYGEHAIMNIDVTGLLPVTMTVVLGFTMTYAGEANPAYWWNHTVNNVLGTTPTIVHDWGNITYSGQYQIKSTVDVFTTVLKATGETPGVSLEQRVHIKNQTVLPYAQLESFYDGNYDAGNNTYTYTGGAWNQTTHEYTWNGSVLQHGRHENGTYIIQSGTYWPYNASRVLDPLEHYEKDVSTRSNQALYRQGQTIRMQYEVYNPPLTPQTYQATVNRQLPDQVVATYNITTAAPVFTIDVPVTEAIGQFNITLDPGAWTQWNPGSPVYPFGSNVMAGQSYLAENSAGGVVDVPDLLENLVGNLLDGVRNLGCLILLGCAINDFPVYEGDTAWIYLITVDGDENYQGERDFDYGTGQDLLLVWGIGLGAAVEGFSVDVQIRNDQTTFSYWTRNDMSVGYRGAIGVEHIGGLEPGQLPLGTYDLYMNANFLLGGTQGDRIYNTHGGASGTGVAQVSHEYAPGFFRVNPIVTIAGTNDVNAEGLDNTAPQALQARTDLTIPGGVPSARLISDSAGGTIYRQEINVFSRTGVTLQWSIAMVMTDTVSLFYGGTNGVFTQNKPDADTYRIRHYPDTAGTHDITFSTSVYSGFSGQYWVDTSGMAAPSYSISASLSIAPATAENDIMNRGETAEFYGRLYDAYGDPIDTVDPVEIRPVCGGVVPPGTSVFTSAGGSFSFNYVIPSNLEDTYASTVPGVDEAKECRLYVSRQYLLVGASGYSAYFFDIDAGVYVQNFTVAREANGEYISEFNSGDTDNLDPDTNHVRLTILNARGELTNQFNNLHVQRDRLNPFTGSVVATDDITLTNTGSNGIYSGSYAAFSNWQSGDLQWTMISQDTNGNTDEHLTTSVAGLVHYWISQLAVSDNHVLRSQSTVVTTRIKSSRADQADDGTINFSPAEEPGQFLLNQRDLYDDSNSHNYEYTRAFESGDSITYTYDADDTLDYRDFRTNVEKDGVGGLDYADNVADFNIHTRQGVFDDDGVILVDDLTLPLIVSIDTDSGVYNGGDLITTTVTYDYVIAAGTPANEEYDNLCLTHYDPALTEVQAPIYYSESATCAESTDANGQVIWTVRIDEATPAGDSYRVTGTTYTFSRSASYDIRATGVITQWYVHEGSTLAGALEPATQHNRGEPVELHVYIPNALEAPTSMILRDTGNGNEQLATGTWDQLTQTITYQWIWSATETASPAGATHQPTISFDLAGQAYSIQPEAILLYNVLGTDIHPQKSTPLNTAIPDEYQFVRKIDEFHLYLQANNIRGEPWPGIDIQSQLIRVADETLVNTFTTFTSAADGWGDAGTWDTGSGQGYYRIEAWNTPTGNTVTVDQLINVIGVFSGDPLTIIASPIIANPDETVSLAIHEAFTDGEARTGNAAGTRIYIYDATGALVINGANPAELQFGAYQYDYTLGPAPTYGNWHAIVETTDIGTGVVNSAATTFYVESPVVGGGGGNSDSFTLVGPSSIKIPATGSSTYALDFTYDDGTSLDDPDFNLVEITAVDGAGNPPTGITLGGAPAGQMTRQGTGDYDLPFTVSSTAAPNTVVRFTAHFNITGADKQAVFTAVLQEDTASSAEIADLDADLQSALAALLAEHAETQALLIDIDGDIVSFRAHYDATQSAWEATWDSRINSVEQLIRSEQNATEIFIQARYDDRTAYLDAMKASLDAQLSNIDGDVAAARASIEALINDVDADIISFRAHYDAREDAAVAQAQTDYNNLVAHVTAEHETTRALITSSQDGNDMLVQAFWADYNATAEADKQQVLAAISDLSTDVDSFRAYYTSRQDTWEATWDSRINSVEQLIRSEQNATEIFIQARYDDRTSYLDAMEASINAFTRAEHIQTRDILNATIQAHWAAWNITFDAAKNEILTHVTDETTGVEQHITAAFADHVAYTEGKWAFWRTHIDAFWADMNTTIEAHHLNMTDSFQETWTRLEALSNGASQENQNLRDALYALWADYNFTSSTDTAAILSSISGHDTDIKAALAALDANVAQEHTYTRQNITAFQQTWQQAHDQWLGLFATYWADYNATEASTYALIQDFWADMNATLANHLAALLAFQDMAATRFDQEQVLIQDFWADMNATLQDAGQDRQAKYDGILANLTAATSQIISFVNQSQTEVLANITDLREFTNETITNLDIKIKQQFGDLTQTFLTNITQLYNLTQENSEFTEIFYGYWADHNQTWADWYDYFSNIQSTNENIGLREIIISQHNETRSLGNFTAENYFLKYGAALAEFRDFTVKAVNEEVLTNREHIDDGNEASFGNLLWTTLILDVLKIVFYVGIATILLMFVGNKRTRSAIKKFAPLAAYFERREMKKTQVALEEAREQKREGSLHGRIITRDELGRFQ